MNKPTYAQQAADLNLWREHVDPQRAVSDEDFHTMSLVDREAFIVESFGPEIVIPTVEDVLLRTHIGYQFHEWGGRWRCDPCHPHRTSNRPGGRLRPDRSELGSPCRSRRGLTLNPLAVNLPDVSPAAACVLSAVS